MQHICFVRALAPWLHIICSGRREKRLLFLLPHHSRVPLPSLTLLQAGMQEAGGEAREAALTPLILGLLGKVS